ncbi:hypothetical protein HD554DRAFT_2172794 [Boletus coccyginus]|nr:hypothetical protein HD554DRAFT_2172794 [Boletus coccyginus]
MVWGNSQAVLKQHPKGIVVHDKLLVRDEYRIASQKLESNAYKAGAYITGQPGIGETHFLVYLLILHLGQRKPVVMQFLNGKPFYALFKDTVGFHSLDDDSPLYGCPESTWILCDSNKFVTSPDAIFMGPGLWIILTTPPKASVLEEINMKTLAEKWGNVPSSLVQYIGEDDEDDEDFYHEGTLNAVHAFQVMMDQGPQLDLP